MEGEYSTQEYVVKAGKCHASISLLSAIIMYITEFCEGFMVRSVSHGRADDLLFGQIECWMAGDESCA